jgi:hypothetical protein
MSDSFVWISTLSEEMYHRHYGDAVKTWHNLPGKKIIFFDGTIPDLDFVEFIDYWSVIDRNNEWFSKKQSKKVVRLSYKAWIIDWAVRNLKYDRIIFLDADVTVHKPVPEELLSNGDHLWSTLSFNHSSNSHWAEYSQQVESGLQIFNLNHPDIENYIDTYINFYKTGKVYDLYRPYDNWVSRAMINFFPLDNLVTDPGVKRYVGEDTFKFTKFAGFMSHYLGKENKERIPKA